MHLEETGEMFEQRENIISPIREHRRGLQLRARAIFPLSCFFLSLFFCVTSSESRRRNTENRLRNSCDPEWNVSFLLISTRQRYYITPRGVTEIHQHNLWKNDGRYVRCARNIFMIAWNMRKDIKWLLRTSESLTLSLRCSRFCKGGRTTRTFLSDTFSEKLNYDVAYALIRTFL